MVASTQGLLPLAPLLSLPHGLRASADTDCQAQRRRRLSSRIATMTQRDAGSLDGARARLGERVDVPSADQRNPPRATTSYDHRRGMKPRSPGDSALLDPMRGDEHQHVTARTGHRGVAAERHCFTASSRTLGVPVRMALLRLHKSETENRPQKTMYLASLFRISEGLSRTVFLAHISA